MILMLANVHLIVTDDLFNAIVWDTGSRQQMVAVVYTSKHKMQMHSHIAVSYYKFIRVDNKIIIEIE